MLWSPHAAVGAAGPACVSSQPPGIGGPTLFHSSAAWPADVAFAALSQASPPPLPLLLLLLVPLFCAFVSPALSHPALSLVLSPQLFPAGCVSWLLAGQALLSAGGWVLVGVLSQPAAVVLLGLADALLRIASAVLLGL